MLRVLEDNDVVCIVGSGIIGGRYQGSSNRVLGHTIVPYLAAERYGFCSMFVEMDNLATKPSSRDDSLVAILSI